MHFPSLDEDAGVRDALNLNRQAGSMLAAYHEQILRGDSALSVAERELVAAYVSALNECGYCQGTHEITASFFGVPAGMIDRLLADEKLEAAPETFRPMLAFARKLTLDHGSISVSDAHAVFDAGWSERALHDLILVASMFNFMNRFVHGHGIAANESTMAERGKFLFEHGYAGIVQPAESPEIEQTTAVTG